MSKEAILKTWAVLGVLAVITMGTGIASADSWEKERCDKGHAERSSCDRHHDKCRHHHHHHWMKGLNLTDDQVMKIDQIRSDRKRAVKTAFEQMRAEHQKLRDMMKGASTDAQLREQHDKVAALRAKIGDAFFDSMLKTRAVLTPEQRKKIGSRCNKEKGMDCERNDEPRD